MVSRTELTAAGDSAQSHLRAVERFLMGSMEAAGDLEIRLINGLWEAAFPMWSIWQTVTGLDSANPARGGLPARISEVRGLLFRSGRLLPVNGEGTSLEAHLLGTASTLDALLALLALVVSTPRRSAAILHKTAVSTHQSALHGYAIALGAQDTAVTAVLNSGGHEQRIAIAQRLHRGVISIASAAEIWTR